MINNRRIEQIMLSEKNLLNNPKLNEKMDNFIEQNITKDMFIQLLQFIVTIFVCAELGILFYNISVGFNPLSLILSILLGILSLILFKGLLSIAERR